MGRFIRSPRGVVLVVAVLVLAIGALAFWHSLQGGTDFDPVMR